MATNPKQQLSVRDTARLLDVPEQSVLRWARKGTLPSRSVGGNATFELRDVEQWARRTGMRLRGESAAKADAEPNALAHSIRRGGLVTIHGAARVDDVLQTLVEQIELPAGVAADQLLGLLRARERLASTAVGDGVALPHPRQPIASLAEPIVYVARLAEPVDFGALDKTPVQLVLLILSHSLKGHLDMLRRVAMVLKVPNLRDSLEHEPDLETLCRLIEAHPE